MRFLCDQMLGRLARWLRFLGFDTFYANNEMTDDELLDIAKEDDRVLITRDKELVFRCRRRLIPVIHITIDDVEDQLLRTLESSNAEIDDDTILSRCSDCNSILNAVDKDFVQGKVPKRVFEGQENFLYCSECDRVYWMGTHTENIMEKLDRIKKKLDI